MEQVIKKCVEWRYDFKYEDNRIIIDNFTGDIANIDQLSIMYIVGKEKLNWAYSIDQDQMIIYQQNTK